MISIVQLLASGVADQSGQWLENGTVTSYISGTTTLTPLFQDFDATTPHPNPATLDAAGRLFAYAKDRVKLVFHSSNGAMVRTIDDIGISESQITSSISSTTAGNGLVANGNQYDVNVDTTTITIIGDRLSVAPKGIGAGQIEDDIRLPGNSGTSGTFKVGTNGPTLSDGDPGLASDEKIYPGSTSGAALTQKSGSSRTLQVETTGGGTALPLVVSAAPTHGLKIIRGFVASDGTINSGEGFSVSKNSTGQYTISYSEAFADVPSVTATPRLADAAAGFSLSNDFSASSCRVIISQMGTNNDVDGAFCFVAIGQRGS